MRVYFAHPVSDYNTEKERMDLETISKNFLDAEIINPNKPEHEASYKKEGMKYFEDLVSTCDSIVCVPFADGEWGMGVWREAETMAKKGGDVIQLHNGNLEVIDYKDIRPLSITETRKRVRKDDPEPEYVDSKLKPPENTYVVGIVSEDGEKTICQWYGSGNTWGAHIYVRKWRFLTEREKKQLENGEIKAYNRFK